MTRIKTDPAPRTKFPPQKPTVSEPIAPIDSCVPRRRFYRGWIVLGVAAVGIFASAPGQSYSVATFKETMRADLSISDSSFSGAYLVATLMSGALLPFVGRLLDRFGARVLLPVIAAALGAACWWMSTVTTLAGLYVGFCLVRPLGQGSLTLICTWMAGHWFERRRGMAMGLLGIGGTLSVMCVPQINHFIMTTYSWQTAWICLGIGVWGLLILPAALFTRNRPEDLGLLPDGDSPGETHAIAKPEAPVPHSALRDSWTVSQAWRTVTFWKLLIPICTGSLVGTGLIFHQVSIFAERGMSQLAAVSMLGFQAMVALVFGLLFGYLTDRVPARFLLVGAMLSLASAQCLTLVMGSGVLIFVYAACLGMHGAVMRTAGTAVWIDYYGRLHQGAIRGLVLTFAIGASAFGPQPLALAKDYLGSYRLAILALLILPLASACIVWSAHPPMKGATPDKSAGGM